MPKTNDIKTDICSAADVDQLIHHFYVDKVLNDSIIGFIFTDVANINLETHLPKVTSFWCQLLLNQPGYQGGLFRSHLHVNQHVTLDKDHFHRWLYLFDQSVDDLFAGTIADTAKQKAREIASSMINGLNNPY